MQNLDSSPRPPRRPIGLALVYSAVCLLIDFWPRHGRPFFRYTGSDPERGVWNFGWPIAWVIYDPKYGIQGELWPLLIALLAMQFGVLAAALIMLTVWRRRNEARPVRVG